MTESRDARLTVSPAVDDVAQRDGLAVLVECGFSRAAHDGVSLTEVLLVGRTASGRLVGAVQGTTRARSRESEVWHLGVLPDCRRRGYGRVLLAAFVEHERCAGADHVLVQVSPGGRHELRTFDEECGFRWNGTYFRRELG